jgi:hypothetical protein
MWLERTWGQSVEVVDQYKMILSAGLWIRGCARIIDISGNIQRIVITRGCLIPNGFSECCSRARFQESSGESWSGTAIYGAYKCMHKPSTTVFIDRPIIFRWEIWLKNYLNLVSIFDKIPFPQFWFSKNLGGQTPSLSPPPLPIRRLSWWDQENDFRSETLIIHFPF